MDDRQPKYPGRVKLRDVETGTEKVYDMTMADEPSVEGDPPTKKNLLEDITCDILKIPRTAVVNEALLKLALGIGKYGYLLTVTFWDGTPAPGVTIEGANTPDGGTPITDESGIAAVVSSETSITVSFKPPWVDVSGAESVTIESSGILTRHTQLLTRKNNITIDTSGQYVFSEKVETYDLCAVGAGGAGHKGDAGYGHPGGGGSAGEAVNKLGIAKATHPSINVKVGAGTTAKGGTTTVTGSDESALCTATGGLKGGVADMEDYSPGGKGNNGNGGDGVEYKAGLDVLRTNGKPGKVYRFNDPSCGLTGGGGPGGYIFGSSTHGAPKHLPTGGSPNTATGGYNWGAGYNEGEKANATKAGIGGGGGGSYQDWGQKPSNGGPGGVYVRCHYEDGSVTEWII